MALACLSVICCIIAGAICELSLNEAKRVGAVSMPSSISVRNVVDVSTAQSISSIDAEAIYQEKCASCHGADGSGNEDEYDEPLWGDLTVTELTRVISETMPEDDPDSCTGEEALEVARYIYEKFYSRSAAQTRGFVAPPRVQLQRLTIARYRNSVADLLAAFSPAGMQQRDFSEAARGLNGIYYQSDGMNKAESEKLRRVDPAIDFDFGNGSPADGISSEQFFVIWNGAFEAPHTGYYEFRISSPNGFKLFINCDPEGVHGKHRDDSSKRLQVPLLDGWVSSSEMRELSGRVFLLGGRTYPVRLEFFKYKEASSSIRLDWKPPHGVWGPLDEQNLVAELVPATFVIDTPFPADDRSDGYERGTSVSSQWLDSISQASVSVADAVVQRLPLFLGNNYANEAGRISAKDFVVRFARRSWRRELSPDEKLLFESVFEVEEDVDAAIRRAVVMALSSPHFLYTNLPREAGADETASRLALTLWDSIPDGQLLAAAEQSALATEQQLREQAARMLNDPRARAKLSGFFEHWLEIGHRDFSKDKQLYPDFDEEVIADLRLSLELFVSRVVWSETSDFRELLLADYLLLNPRLRELYPGEGEATAQEPSTAFEPIVFESEGRAGVLTHPYLLSAFAYHNNSSPIHRGVFLTRNIMGRSIRPPPEAVAFEESEFAANLTMREKITQLTRGTACMSCHSVINPMGFVLEEFDAVGRLRTIENDQPVDTESDYTAADGTTITIRSAREVAEYAALSPSAHRVFVGQLFQHLTKQNLSAFGPDAEDNLMRSFEQNEFNIRELVIDMALLAASGNNISDDEANSE